MVFKNGSGSRVGQAGKTSLQGESFLQRNKNNYMYTGRYLALLLLFCCFAFFACQQPRPDPQPQLPKSYIKQGASYFPLTTALAVYDQTDPQQTLFTLRFTGSGGNLAYFDFLIVDPTTQLPEGEFPFLQTAASSAFQRNKFHDLFIRYGDTMKSTVDPRANVIQSSKMQIKKVNGQYQISGLVKADNQDFLIYYEGVVEHKEAW
jgi:hypothetical protein